MGEPPAAQLFFPEYSDDHPENGPAHIFMHEFQGAGYLFRQCFGLSGEVRAVSQAELRLREAARLGFTTAVLPEKNARQLDGRSLGIALMPAASIGDALKLALPR